MRGWLLDIYPEYETNSIVYWVRTRKGANKIVDRAFRPKIFVHSTPENLDDLERALPILDEVSATGREMKRTWLGDDEREVLGITIRDYAKVEDVAHTIDNRGRYKDYTLFNCRSEIQPAVLLREEHLSHGPAGVQTEAADDRRSVRNRLRDASALWN